METLKVTDHMGHVDLDTNMILEDKECNIETHSRNLFLPLKSNEHCVFCALVALVIQHATHAPNYFIICGLSGFTVFFTLAHKLHYFRKKVTERETCVLIFSTDAYKNLSF